MNNIHAMKNHKTNIVKMNKLSEKSKKGFNTRFIFSIYIVLFFVISIVFSILSDTKWNWFNAGSWEVKQAFAYIQIFWMLIIPILAARELTSLHFYRNWLMLIIIIFSFIACSLAPSLIFLFNKFDYLGLSENRYLFILLLTTLITYVIVFVINIIAFWFQGLLDFKKLFIHFAILFLVSGYIISWVYFSFFKGWTTLLILFFLVAHTDASAYICGMLFGKKKMSEYISPNKTLWGGIGGVITTTLIAIIIFIGLSFVPGEYNILGNFFGIKFNYHNDFLVHSKNIYATSPWWWICVFFIINAITIISILGDLAFSYIKRLYDIKDFSDLIPGHGGIIDRIDSHTFVYSTYFIFIVLISFFSSTSGIF